METAEGKKPFDIDVAMERIAQAVEPYPKAAMFELAEQGYDTPFQQLVACVISIRTRDEESLPISLRLFAAAPTAEDIVTLTPQQIDARDSRLLRPRHVHRQTASGDQHGHRDHPSRSHVDLLRLASRRSVINLWTEVT